jgi:hypothetical protein
MVFRDEVDALAADRRPACWPFSAIPTATWRPSAPVTVEPIGIAAPANELPLQMLLASYVRAFEDSGLLEMLRVQWLEKGDWVSALP